jgi:hypothetical protein
MGAPAASRPHSGARRRAAHTLPPQVDLPSTHRGLTSDDLRRVGMPDEPSAAAIWIRERAVARRWLADALMNVAPEQSRPTR